MKQALFCASPSLFHLILVKSHKAYFNPHFKVALYSLVKQFISDESMKIKSMQNHSNSDLNS